MFFLILPVILFFGNPNFNLTIKAINLPAADSASVYIYDAQSRELIDSTRVLNQQFSIQRNQTEAEKRYVIRIHDTKWHNFILWANPGTILIDAKHAEFMNAHVSGSKSHDLQIQFMQAAHDKEATIQLFKDHKNSLVALQFLYGVILAKEITIQEAITLFDLTSDSVKNSSLGIQTQKQLAQIPKPKLGEKFVDFSLPDTSGTVQQFSKIMGKVTLIEFWGSWCSPCRAINPQLMKVYSKWKSKGFEIVGIAVEQDKEAWINAIVDDGLTWPQLSDLSGNESFPVMAYSANSLPYNVLIDENGIIIEVKIFPKKLDETLSQLLK
jgi:thiol-disulfide isomerase/thioredoxin